MVLQSGIRVRVDGQEATVELSWASGKHTQTTLSDGRTIVDLEKAIADGDAQVLDAAPAPEPSIWHRSRVTEKEIERLPTEDEDLEE